MNRMSVFFSILTHILTGNTITPQYIFVIQCFYSVLAFGSVNIFSRGCSGLAELYVSFKRIETFMQKPEITLQEPLLECDVPKTDESVPLLSQPVSPVTNPGIQILNAGAAWASTSDFALTNVNISVQLQQLVAVVGPVGAGKTSLLQIILQELPLRTGSVHVSGRVSYCAQEPWLFGGTIRQNILFGQPFDLNKYNAVVKMCALEADLLQLQYHDQTLVGDRGVMISGGQRARINLARAIYKDADIYLLDDPLSAVDAEVARRVFKTCISEFLRDKCVVFVTHDLHYLKTLDQFYVLKDGTVTQGHLERTEILKETLAKAAVPQPPVNEEVPTDVKERQIQGAVAFAVYRSYVASSGSIWLFLLVVIISIMGMSIGWFIDYFLKLWLDKNTNNSQRFFYIYIALSVVNFLIIFVISYTMVLFCCKVSRNLHELLLKRVVNASIRFFHVNPAGRILNRFAKDIGTLDEELPFVLLGVIQATLIIIFVVLVVSVVIPWVILPSGVMLGVALLLRFYFIRASRNLKRLEATRRSFLYSHLAASVKGLTTIRAFSAQETLCLEFDELQDSHTSVFHLFLSCTRAFGLYLDVFYLGYLTFVLFNIIYAYQGTSGTSVGLCITQLVMITRLLQYVIRQWSDLETQMTSVERILEYTHLPPEQQKITTLTPILISKNGSIEFNSVFLRYSESEPYVLKNVSFTVRCGEKIGIVGRTGAGKSSLISVLFRMMSFQGTITVDGVDIKALSLKTLRSQFSIIPQTPLLFVGTIRNNLDPFQQSTDANLWQILEELQLKTIVEHLPNGLEATISENGSNLSVGQCQLICLARALIHRTNILILDEATASIDSQTDSLIQRIIREKFQSCTVLTIAHRLETVMDSDKILVMDGGQVVEFDKPFTLLQDSNGYFSKLVQQADGSLDLLEMVQNGL